jgi:hypothetical protein
MRMVADERPRLNSEKNTLNYQGSRGIVAGSSFLLNEIQRHEVGTWRVTVFNPRSALKGCFGKTSSLHSPWDAWRIHRARGRMTHLEDQKVQR